MRQRKILLVEDDLDLVRALRPELEEAGFAVVWTPSGKEALANFAIAAPDAVMLDVGLLDLDGFEVCQRIRGMNANLPVLFLTSRGDEVDRVTGFALGADDYVVKPFSMRELVFRVKALLRRSDAVLTAGASGQKDEIVIKELRIQPIARRVWLRGEELDLSAIEFDILLFFASHPGRPFSREQLMEQIWAVNSSNFAATVTTQISRLRKKLERDPANPEYLLTVYGVGYRFAEAEGDERVS